MNNLKLRKKVREIIKGKGYIDELEFGCEVKAENGDIRTILSNTSSEIYGYRTDDVSKFENLGKPLELNELLEALQKRVNYNFTYGIVNTWICEIDNINKTFQEVFEYDLKLKPEQQSEEVIKKLIEILK